MPSCALRSRISRGEHVSLSSAVSAAYTGEYQRLLTELAPGNKEDLEREAQRRAIQSVFAQFYLTHPSEAIAIWDSLRSAHIKRKSNIDLDLSEIQIEAVRSADQSWKKSSGHAAESFWVAHASPALLSKGLKLLLQRELLVLMREGRLANETRDLETLSGWISSSSFDLYVGRVTEGEKFQVFGCVQSKTSIRDRVTRDREPSTQAMSKFFWSVCLVIDGRFLSLHKFQSMVDGGTAQYPSSGWHGLYALQTPYTSNRIHQLSRDVEPFASHCLLASQQFSKNRQWLSEGWSPQSSS